MVSNRWLKLVWIIPIAVIVLAGVVLLARWLRSTEWMSEFLVAYPGETALPDGAPVGLPAWLGWSHYFNFFLMALIISSGWQVRTVPKPAAYWTRNNSGPVRTKGAPRKIRLDLWFHLFVDALWGINGIVFVVLLCVTGQWMRIVPTSWDVFPNAVSAAIQYVSLDWPTENGWANYNSLQLLSYFGVVFIAAPLAALTGIRMTAVWPKDAHRLNRIYRIEIARAVHFPVMLFFVLFILVHVTLVLATGALRNLNHMYWAGDDSSSWVGFGIFVGSTILAIGACFAATPVILRPIAGRMGKVTRQ